MTFRPDIKACMKDCILAVLWPKQAIYDFFVSHSCTAPELALIKDLKDPALARGKMIDIMFSALAKRQDGGIGQFRAMLKSLAEWSHFDTYYFDQLRKLDRDVALRHIRKLKALQEARDSQIKEQRKRQDVSEESNKNARVSRESLKLRFIELYSTDWSPQKRGYALEKILQEIAKVEGLQTTEPFRITGEQIDGAVKYDGEHYLIEAKWHDAATSTEPLYAFAHKVDGKMYGRGMFISINGFSPTVVQALIAGKAITTILVDGEDLLMALEERISFTKMIDEKVKSAQLKGQIYIHPVTLKSKI